MEAHQQFLIWLMIVVPGVLPPLGRSTRMLCILAAVGAIVPLYWWGQAFSTSDGKSRALAMVIAMHPTTSWVIGMTIAILQRIGISRGWALARFPIPALTALVVVGTLNLIAVGRFFEWL